MYQFSRSIYRELAGEVIEDGKDAFANRLAFLKSCESAMERLAGDRHYFARPARSLFRDVRVYFPMSSTMYGPACDGLSQPVDWLTTRAMS